MCPSRHKYEGHLHTSVPKETSRVSSTRDVLFLRRSYLPGYTSRPLQTGDLDGKSVVGKRINGREWGTGWSLSLDNEMNTRKKGRGKGLTSRR